MARLEKKAEEAEQTIEDLELEELLVEDLSEEIPETKKISGKKKMLLAGEIVVLLLVVVVAVVVLFLRSVWDDMGHGHDYSATEAGVNSDLPQATVKKLQGYTNIALFGLDNRGGNDYGSGNSDSIMVASINNSTKEIRLVSVYRDTFLQVSEGKYKKANAAYAIGGNSFSVPEDMDEKTAKQERADAAALQAMWMLNTNLDLNITQYVCVDWGAVVKTIDALGGIDLEITEEEVKYINYYLGPTSKGAGVTSKEVTQSGLVHLDGAQATSYARIRYTRGDDYKRASRQRIVLGKMFELAKEADLGTLIEIIQSVSSRISTNIDFSTADPYKIDFLSMATNIADYNLASTTGFPFDLTTKKLPATGDTVIPVSLENNVMKLHQYLFGLSLTEVSETVHSIDQEIVGLTGVSSQSGSIDLSDLNETVGATGTEGLKKEE